MAETRLEAYLRQEAFGETLTHLYGAEGRERARTRCAEVMEGFEKSFGYPAEALFSAPGRTEIGGNHTDHQRGCVLAAAVDLDILAAAAGNGSGVIRVLSQGYPMTEVALSELTPREDEVNTSAALIRGVAARMSELGCGLRNRGQDVYMTSTVPKGSGLSSSAAYEVLMGTMLNELFWEGRCTPVELAQIGQYAENVFFGKPCGLMDQTASAVGGIIAIDFADPAAPVVTPVPFDFAACGHALCIIDSGADHADLTAEYAAIPAELKTVCEFFGKEYLRDVSEDEFYQKLPGLRRYAGDRAVLRAFHFYADNDRVAQQVAALRGGDFDAFLQLVTASGDSSWEYLQNVIPAGYKEHQEMGVTIAAAKHYLQGKGAVRVHGGGFAGTAQAFVPVDMLADFKAHMEAILGEGRCHVLNIRPEGGAVL